MPKKQISLRVEESDLEQWKALAAKEKRTLTSFIERLANTAVTINNRTELPRKKSKS